jgi:hypothetical protein
LCSSLCAVFIFHPFVFALFFFRGSASREKPTSLGASTIRLNTERMATYMQTYDGAELDSSDGMICSPGTHVCLFAAFYLGVIQDCATSGKGLAA